MKTILCILALTLLGASLTAQSDTRQESEPFTKLQKVTVTELKTNALASPVAVAEAANIPVVVAVVQSAPIASGGDAKSFIYSKESGNNPGSINASSGACGLGQALPCGKMPCSLSDYACQDNFFTQYMSERYGSWEAARSFWLNHSWW